MEVKRERYPYCVVLDFMIDYFKNEWRWDVDIKDTFDIYSKTIISLGSKSTLGSTTKKLEFGDDKKLDLVRTNVSFYYDPNVEAKKLEVSRFRFRFNRDSDSFAIFGTF